MNHLQCDEIGQFLKFSAIKFRSKVAQIISNFLGYFEKPHSYIKTAVATSRVTFGNILVAFAPTSGHTDNQ